MLSLLFGFLLLTSCAIGLDLPANFKNCKRSEANQCLKDAIQDALPKLRNGLPELNFDSLNPLRIASMTIGSGKGAVQLIQHLTDVEFSGIDEATINEAKLDYKNSKYTLTIDAYIKKLVMAGKYSLDGKILLLPIAGNGNGYAEALGIRIRFVISGDEINKKGEVFLRVNNTTTTLDTEHVHVQLDNLFNGNELLTTEMNNVLNENWKDLWLDTKQSYEEAYSEVFKSLANKIFKNVPSAELFPV